MIGAGTHADDMTEPRKTYPEIGERLLKLRRHHDKTQAEWAALHRFNSTQYANWETGARRIPLDAAYVLCDTFGLTLDFIYRGKLDGVSQTALKIFMSQ